MSQKLSSCLGVTFLGFLSLIPGVNTLASTVSDNSAQVVGSEISGEEMSVEHGKINTADASPVDPGHFEVEPSFSYTRAKRYWDNTGHSHSRGLEHEQNIGLSVTAGVVEDVDVNISGGYSWLKDNDNDFDENDDTIGPTTGYHFIDLELSGRYRFYKNEEQHLEIAYIGSVTIPTGSSSNSDRMGTSQEFWSFNQTLVVSKDWGKWTANIDVGYALPIGNKRENARGTMSSDVALGYQVLPWLQPEVELNYSHDYFENEDNAQMLAVTVGLVLPINKLLRVNIGVQQGFWGENTDKATTLFTAVKFAF